MKKIIISNIITFIITLGLFAGLNIYHLSKKETFGEKGILKTTKVSSAIPGFAIFVEGIYNQVWSDENFQEFQKYEIDAVVDDGYNKERHIYTGIPLKQILNEFGIDHFNYIEFIGSGERSVIYRPSEINDDMYIIFSRNDGGFIDGERVNLIHFGLTERNWMTDLDKVIIG